MCQYDDQAVIAATKAVARMRIGRNLPVEVGVPQSRLGFAVVGDIGEDLKPFRAGPWLPLGWDGSALGMALMLSTEFTASLTAVARRYEQRD